MNILRFVFFAAVAGLIFSLSSCKKDDSSDNQIPNTDTIGELSFNLKQYVGNNRIAYNQVYSDTSGRQFKITNLRYYISDIVLLKANGQELPLSGKVLLVDNETEQYSLGEIPVGDYSGLRFMVGIDSATNHLDPALYDASNPLSYQPVSMHWGWNFGYIFMKVEGNVDTDTIPTGNLNGIISYDIGSDPMVRVINFNHIFSVNGNTNTINIKFNLLKMLSGIDLATESITHTNPGRDLAERIANNWLNSFTIEP
ncbi:MAG TPA: hypothetical protein P5221_01480 [Bacteroidia bacterium]|nr:hypothetical protein [Bacteroidia bacterium]